MWKTNRLGPHIQVASQIVCARREKTPSIANRERTTTPDGGTRVRCLALEGIVRRLAAVPSAVEDIAFGVEREFTFQSADAADSRDGPYRAECAAM